MAFALLALGVAELIIRALDIPSYVVPTPSAVGIWLYQNWKTALADTAFTGGEAIAGFTVAACGALLAFYVWGGNAAGRRNTLRAAATLQAIPILAIAPFLVAWFGPQMGSKIAASGLICAPVIFTGLFGASESISDDELCFARRVYPQGAEFARRFLLLRSLPGLFTGLRAAAPLSVLGAIVGEFVGASAGLGFRILTGSYYLRLAEMVAAVVLAVALSFVLIGMVLAVERRLVFWGNKRV